MSNDFRDERGRWLTQALFPETNQGSTDKYLRYRLRDGTGKKYAHLPVLRDLYMDTMDPTEYRFAQKYLGGWEHWQRLLGNALIRAHVEEWREELEVKMISTGVMQQIDIALDSENKGRGAASKWLAEGGFKPKRQAGRPTKQEVEREKKIQSRVKDSVSSDLERLRNLQ